MTTLSINASEDTVNHHGSLGKLVLTDIAYDCYYEYGKTSYAEATKGKVVAKEGGEVTVLYATAAAVAAVEDGGTINTAYCVSTTQVEESEAGYTNFSNSKDGNVVFKYVDEQEDPLTAAKIVEAAENAIASVIATEKADEDTNYQISIKNDTTGDIIYTTFTGFRDLVMGVNEDGSYKPFAEAQNLAGYTVKLISDVEISGTWLPIGSYRPLPYESNRRLFAGTFDGQGHTIRANVDNTAKYNELAVSRNNPDNEYQYTGVFGSVTGSATVKNFIVEGSFVCLDNTSTNKNETRAAIVNAVYRTAAETDDSIATISNIINNASITASKAAGIMQTDKDNPKILIDGCINNGDITGSAAGCYSAGIYAQSGTPYLTIKNCTNNGTVSNMNTNSAGILGCVGNGGAQILNCHNSGYIFGKVAAGIALDNGGTVPNIDYLSTNKSDDLIQGTTEGRSIANNYKTNTSENPNTFATVASIPNLNTGETIVRISNDNKNSITAEQLQNATKIEINSGVNFSISTTLDKCKYLNNMGNLSFEDGAVVTKATIVNFGTLTINGGLFDGEWTFDPDAVHEGYRYSPYESSIHIAGPGMFYINGGTLKNLTFNGYPGSTWLITEARFENAFSAFWTYFKLEEGKVVANVATGGTSPIAHWDTEVAEGSTISYVDENGNGFVETCIIAPAN